MKHFKSWRSYANFVNKTQYSRRFIHDKEVMEFLHTLLETSKPRVREIKKSTLLWRAQQGCEIYAARATDRALAFEEEKPYSPKRMKPLPRQASEGRANPKGIPCLYLSTKKKTALTEVRPWMGSLITLAKFIITMDLKLVDCSMNALQKIPYYLNEPAPVQREKIVWTYIDRAFSKPIQCCDQIADYVPTQVIAEFFKANKFDGIIYQSNFDNGQNIALFNLNVAEVQNCVVYEATKIRLNFREVSNPPRRRSIRIYPDT